MPSTRSQKSNGDPRASKRQRLGQHTESPHDSSHPVHELLTPRATSRGTTPDSINPNEVEWFDDECHDNIEWIRLPKKRDYDIFRVTRHRPEDRDVNKAEVPLTAIRHDGKEVTLWAKMDTGSELNTINRSTLTALLGAENMKHRVQSMTEQDFNLINEQTLAVKNFVKLDFSAGQSKKKFEKVHFVVLDVNAETEDKDGVPNVLLGLPFLWEHSTLQADVEFCHDADPSLPVIAERCENEGGHAGPLPIVKIPATKGFPRPTR